SDPPTAAQIAAAEVDIAEAVGRALSAVPAKEAATVVGGAGTGTTVAGIALGLPAYDAERIHRTRGTAAEVAGVTDELLGMDRAARLAIPVMHPGRADVIAAGAMILRAVVAATAADAVVASEHDILDGIAWSLA